MELSTLGLGGLLGSALTFLGQEIWNRIVGPRLDKLGGAISITAIEARHSSSGNTTDVEIVVTIVNEINQGNPLTKPEIELLDKWHGLRQLRAGDNLLNFGPKETKTLYFKTPPFPRPRQGAEVQMRFRIADRDGREYVKSVVYRHNC